MADQPIKLDPQPRKRSAHEMHVAHLAHIAHLIHQGRLKKGVPATESGMTRQRGSGADPMMRFQSASVSSPPSSPQQRKLFKLWGR